MKALQITAEDQYKLSAHLFKPQVSNGKLLLINGATGVRQYLYFSFAQYFSDRGYTVVTYDYRGIGESKPQKLSGFKASMRSWGNLDFKAVTTFLNENFSDLEWYCLGHSVGALILGMNEDSLLFRKFVFVATQKAYIGNLNLKTRITACLGFGLAQPVTTRFAGYFPAQYFGLGESLPAGAGYDWRTLILNRKSTNKLLNKRLDIAASLKQEVYILRADDDVWVTEKGISTLLEETYPHLRPEFRLLKHEVSPQKNIGHINFFRSYNKGLWHVVSDWLEA